MEPEKPRILVGRGEPFFERLRVLFGPDAADAARRRSERDDAADLIDITFSSQDIAAIAADELQQVEREIARLAPRLAVLKIRRDNLTRRPGDAA
jgi:hypothetical protein